MEESKYQQLREVVIKANPEIMELKFGCRIKYMNDEKIGIFVSPETNEYKCVIYYDDLHLQFTDEFYDYKIIGRPIRLADVLLAVREVEKNIWIDRYGHFVHRDVKFNEVNAAEWNLKDDKLDNQSEETKEFLYSLLVQ